MIISIFLCILAQFPAGRHKNLPQKYYNTPERKSLIFRAEAPAGQRCCHRERRRRWWERQKTAGRTENMRRGYWSLLLSERGACICQTCISRSIFQPSGTRSAEWRRSFTACGNGMTRCSISPGRAVIFRIRSRRLCFYRHTRKVKRREVCYEVQ